MHFYVMASGKGLASTQISISAFGVTFVRSLCVYYYYFVCTFWPRIYRTYRICMANDRHECMRAYATPVSATVWLHILLQMQRHA